MGIYKFGHDFVAKIVLACTCTYKMSNHICMMLTDAGNCLQLYVIISYIRGINIVN